MFGFMKKLTDKDKEEKERKKKERLEKEQKKHNNGLTADELIRLEEAKQSLQNKKNASASITSGGDLSPKVTTFSNTSLRPTKGPPPVIHPKPVKRGFSKDKLNVAPSTSKKDAKSKSDVVFQAEVGLARESFSLNCAETGNGSSTSEKESTNRKLFDSSFRKFKEGSADGKVLLVGVHKKRGIPMVSAETPEDKSEDLLYTRMAPILQAKPSELRTIVLKRLQSGDFGFSLRKGITVTRKTGPADQDVWRQVIFAECGSKNIDLGFLPGDSIIEIGKMNVESSNRETVVDILKKSGDQVEVVVRTLPELTEVVSRLKGSIAPESRKRGALKAKTEDQINSDQLSLTSRDVWISHKRGYSAGKILEQLENGSVEVELEPGTAVHVMEGDVEKMNPSHLDRIYDVTSLRFVNEPSLLHVIRQRYAGNLIHTSAGSSTLVVNSMHPLSIYSEKVAQFFKEAGACDLPPHVFSVARLAFKSMMSSRQDHSIVLMGRSGSGKTFHSQNILNYFVTTHGSVQSLLTYDKLSAIFTLIESFGSCKTLSGFNSTKFTQVFSLHFDQNGQIAGASLQAMMLDKSCMNGLKASNGECCFNIFSQFIQGIDPDLRKELQLEHMDFNHPFLGFAHSTEDSLQRSSQMWNKDLNAFKMLQISIQDVKVICLVLASICHLQAAGVSKGPNNRYHFKDTSSAECAARLLGTTTDDLSKAIFQAGGSSSQLNVNTLSPSLRVGSGREAPLATLTGDDLLESFNSSIYLELFNAIIALINRSLASSCSIIGSILIVDAPGFRETPDGGAKLSDLFHNYVQERLQTLFHENVFDFNRELLSRENVEIDFDFPECRSDIVVKLIDNPPQNLKRNSESRGNLSSDRGLLWLLDEQTLLSSASEEGFVNEIKEEYTPHFQAKNPTLYIGSSPAHFVVAHMNGACPVEYDTRGWLKAARSGGLAKNVGHLLAESKRQEIAELFGRTYKTMGGSMVGAVDAPSTLRRAASMKGINGAVAKKRSTGLQIKFQTDALLDALKRTKSSYVHCLCPHDSANHPDVLNVPLLRKQLRSSLILPSVRLFKQGFPEHLSFLEFVQRFGILARQNSNSSDRNTVEQVLKSLEVDPSNYRLGVTKVFLRSGVLDQLEATKEDQVSAWLIRVQSSCRARLAKRNLQKLKLQHMAVACVQKNIRKFVAVKDWSWWKLYVKIKPLLNVHRTEEELRDVQLEVDQLKQRLEKAEKEKQDYKHAYEKLEMKVTDLALELQDEQNETSQAAEMLENETTKRLELEKELKEVQGSYNLLLSQSQNMETELMSLRMMANSVDVDNGGDDDDDAGGLAYAEKYQRAKREHECTKKAMEIKFEEEKDLLESSKRALEKKIIELTSDNEVLEKCLADFRRKLQKQSQEMADVKHHLEEQTARNSELEKKQRRFDVELSNANGLVKDEKTMRERLQKERDELSGQKFALEKEFKNMEMDFEMQSQKLQKLEREMEEMTSTSKDDKEAFKTRQLKNELESKIKDLEEELDEQAGTIQQLEQTKLRLEMNQERLRQQHAKEIEEKENDLEDLKRTYQKKFKTLEIQLEEEYEEKQKCLREKRDLEKKMQMTIEEKPARDKDMEAILKRDLRRTKALLQDAQLMLQKYKESAGSRQTVKQLKDQLEDAEFSMAAALKAKKAMELELNDLHEQLESMTRLKNETEDKLVSANKEKHELQTRLEDGEEEMSELMKKYKGAVQQHSLDLIKFEDQSHQIELLQKEREVMKEEMARLQSRTEYFEASTVDRETISRLEVKIRDLETKLDLEATTRKRAEILLARLKEQVDSEADSKRSLRSEESKFQDQLRQLQRKSKELEDENNELKLKESDAIKKKQELERKMEEMTIEYDQAQSDLHLAFKRISDLQAVIEEGMESNNASDYSDGDVPLSNEEDDDDAED